MQRIYIEGLGLVEGHFSGIGQYILGILQGMDNLIEENKYTDQPRPSVTVVIPYDKVKKFKSFGFKNINYKKLPLNFRHTSSLWYRGKMFPLDLWCGKGYYIFPRFVKMPLISSESALVIYDLSYELYRQYSDENNSKFLSNGVRRSIKNTSKIITISQNAKKEILNFYKLPGKRVAVATPAVNQSHFYKRSVSEINNVKLKYKIKGEYILALSNLEPRKNLGALVDAYCSLPKEITDNVGLLLVGVNGWKTEKLFEKIITKVESGYNIMRPSKYVSDKDKPAIISGAKLLVYPSHYEGFGMPPLEALACGTAVITSDNSSLPEVVKGVGVMVSSNDTQAIASAISRQIRNWPKFSTETQQSGPEQASKFSWEKSAQVFFDAAAEVKK